MVGLEQGFQNKRKSLIGHERGRSPLPRPLVLNNNVIALVGLDSVYDLVQGNSYVMDPL